KGTTDAHNAKISIQRENSQLCIKVEDDGIGFNNLDKNNHSDYLRGFGLFNIKEGITHHGGYFNIESKPDCGSKAVIKVPLP
ncbi:MAG: hypothetical protein GWN62_20220, partial [Aliifodinibius sp.]|nr:hypothetical protein [Fodinibius sp.]